jgi:hypothetical protein
MASPVESGSPDKAKTFRRDTASYRRGARQQIDVDKRTAR